MDTMQKQAFQAVEQLLLKREQNVQRQQQLAEQMAAEMDVPSHKWTITQLHLLSILKTQGEANNMYLAEQLRISRPAVTKATAILLKHELIREVRRLQNLKEVYYTLTPAGEQLATIHERLHSRLVEQYEQLFGQFDEAELSTIIRFLHAWAACI
ncbi:MarR family transcriptional regulator [Paenibacillus hunanensis]|uniref:MarR family transcriptional regulator n=1 Tax=Paenibacillus hunanensis TaxID=539262 RepID=UPI002026BA3B|nr:MarR family transcriptional regulator [Paenibacillus hunanensis]MCL9659508.1 MarR family transcriptional regulator [Paenibacillus hunanensis]